MVDFKTWHEHFRFSTINLFQIHFISIQVHVPNLGGASESEDRGGGDNSIQFINVGREGDKNFKEWRRRIAGWKGG